ncbi:MAG: NAD-dependent malic enzyme [Nanoarchaeota archaeon]|nr:NAD-dependent malic enzyme [Nanoarchaeota archaeon]
MDIYTQSIKLHKAKGGVLEIKSKVKIRNHKDLSLAYTPGVAAVSIAIAKNKKKAKTLTFKKNSVAIISDGSAVLGLGNIGPEASLPVLEGKAILFKEYANIDAIPLAIHTNKVKEIVDIVKKLEPTFGGINLEDISAPRCFEIEQQLQHIGIPVFHDDQHATAIVVLAALLNASKVIKKPLDQCKIVINGAGAAGTAIAKILKCIGYSKKTCIPVKELIVVDRKGIIYKGRKGLNKPKQLLARITNKHHMQGDLEHALYNADIFVGVSKGNLLKKKHLQAMHDKPVILALANPTPEIDPKKAKAYGAAIIATGRSDYPNQVNNVLAFPGVFRGALDANAPRITNDMKIAAAHALAATIKKPTKNHILPNVLDKKIAKKVAKAVKNAA